MQQDIKKGSRTIKEKQRQQKYKGNAKLDAEVKIFAKINLSH